METTKKYPFLLYGFANMEGLPRIATFDSWKNGMNEKFSDFLPADLKFDNDKQKEEVAKDIKDFFFGDKTIDDDSVLAYVDYFTDVLFAYATLRSVKLHIDNGHEQVYLYEYHFVDDNTPVVLHTNVKGADHCAQSIAVIGELPTPNNNITLTEDFHKMSRTVRQLWANFIKTGAPVPEGSELAAWPAVRGSWAPHMALDRELQLRGSLLERRTRFWDSIYDKHYRNPVPPPAPPARHTEL